MNIAHYFTAMSASESVIWYEHLHKPFFSPPSWAFGVAWSILYPMIALGFILVVVLYFKKRLSLGTLLLFIVNLVSNLLFSPIQFGLKNNLLASADIVIILITLVYVECMLWKKAKGIFWLLLPYMLWVSFATVLQFTITVLNQ